MTGSSATGHGIVVKPAGQFSSKNSTVCRRLLRSLPPIGSVHAGSRFERSVLGLWPPGQGVGGTAAPLGPKSPDRRLWAAQWATSRARWASFITAISSSEISNGREASTMRSRNARVRLQRGVPLRRYLPRSIGEI
jgi:hypothetical protein